MGTIYNMDTSTAVVGVGDCITPKSHRAAMAAQRKLAIEECIKAVAGVMRVDPDLASGQIFDALRALGQSSPTPPIRKRARQP